jgi:AcrR family transcriptional regulator
VATLAVDPTIRRQVMTAARELLAADPSVPIDRIVRRAGVSRATFYRHFGSRGNLLATVDHEPLPPARERVLAAAQERLVRTSLAELSMDDLARAAGMSRGSLYRLFPGKAALLHGLIAAYSPFDAVQAVLRDHRGDPPEVVLRLIARTIVGVSGERLGLMRAVFFEATTASPDAVAAARPILESVLGELSAYVAAQITAGRMRPLHPLIALQAFVGPIFFHLMTRPVLDETVGLPMDPAAAVDELVAISLAGLCP